MARIPCADRLEAFYKGRSKLTNAEIRTILDEFRNRRQGKLDLGDAEFHRIAAEIAADIQESAAIERRNRRINVAVKQRLLDMARDAANRYGDPSLGLEAAAVGINHPIAGGRRSADGIAQSLFADYLSILNRDLDAGGLMPHLNTGYLDGEIARALEKLTDPDARGSSNAIANQIADVIHKTRTLAFDRENRAGAWKKPLRGFVASQYWDAAKVKGKGTDFEANFKAWRDFVLPRLDHERTFKGATPESFLREAYTTIVNGEVLRFTEGQNDLTLAFKGPSNLAKRESQHRVLHFKNADAWMEANSQYGRTTLRGAIMEEFRIAARNTALMETFGTNPRAMFEEVKQALKTEFKENPKAAASLDRSLLRWEMDTILGDSDASANPTLANISAGARAFISAAKLGGAVLSAISDIAFKASAIRYAQGGGILSPYAQAFSSFFESMGKDARATADLIAAGMDGHSAAISRFAGPGAEVGAGSKMLRAFFKWNLLTPWTDAHKRGLGLFTSRMLASHADSAFDQLPEHMRFILEQFDIGPEQWEVARRAVQTMNDGRSYMLPHLFREMADEDFNAIDPLGEGNGLRGRDALASSVRTLFTDIQEMGVPTPGARERAMLTWGFKAGTPEGEGFRFLTQFKSFPVTVISKNIGRLRYGNPGGKADKEGLAMLFASSIILGYAAMTAKNYARGQTHRDPLDYRTWIAAFVQGGGAGIYGDLFLGETNRFGRSLLDTMAGPGFGLVSDIDELRARIMNGDDVAASSLRLAINNAPFVNLFYSRTALDYLVIHQLQELANPGYLRRRERQLKKEQNVEYMLPQPSSVIPRGGGNRIFEGVR